VEEKKSSKYDPSNSFKNFAESEPKSFKKFLEGEK